MKVIVIGAGEVGYDVARILSIDQHDVVVIDTDAEALDSVGDRLDVLTIHGNGTSADTLEQAGIRRADLLVAVAAIDEVNIISCMMASRMGVGTTVARVRSVELTRDRSVLSSKDLGIDLIIHPEESTASEVVGLIRRASATDMLTFIDGHMQLVGIRLDKDFALEGTPIRELPALIPKYDFRLAAIVRGVRTIIPGGNDVLRKNDQVFVFARPKNMPHILNLLGKNEGKIQDVMIMGGTEIGAMIAEQLSAEGRKRVKLIEPNREEAELRAEQLPNVLVIHGNQTDIDLLAAEGLGEMDAFIAITEDEESNLVTCLLAKHLGVNKTVALLSKVAYVPISQSIGLDAAVSRKLAVSREILRFLRGKHVLSVATVRGLDAEILELKAGPRSPVTRSPLKDLKLPKGMLVAAVDHGNKSEVAVGETIINPGDSAIVFVLPSVVAKAEKLFVS